MTLPDELPHQILAFCRAHTGDPEAVVSDPAVVPGHAGFSYGFAVASRHDGEVPGPASRRGRGPSP